MGSGSLLLNAFLLLAYLGHYRPMLAWRGTVGPEPPTAAGSPGTAPARALAAAVQPIMPLLGALACAVGLVMLGWLLVMIAQYLRTPLPLSAIHHLTPR